MLKWVTLMTLFAMLPAHFSYTQAMDTGELIPVDVKWFGSNDPVGFTSNHKIWRYAGAQNLPGTDAVLAGLFDMRLPLTFSLEDCGLIADHILDAATALAPEGAS